MIFVFLLSTMRNRIFIIFGTVTSTYPEPTSPSRFFSAAPKAEIPMADNKDGNRKTLALTAGAVLVVVVGLFVFGGGHNDGQPSSPGGPGNPTQNDQGR